MATKEDFIEVMKKQRGCTIPCNECSRQKTSCNVDETASWLVKRKAVIPNEDADYCLIPMKASFADLIKKYAEEVMSWIRNAFHSVKKRT